MKLAIISPLFLPGDIGGTPIATYNMAKYLAKRDNDICVITAHYRDTPHEEKLEGFFIHRISWPHVRFGVIIFWIKAFRYLLKIKPDIVHIQGNDLSALLYKKFTKTPFVIWGQGQEYNKSFINIYIMKMILKNADVSIALTEHMQRAIIDIYKRQVIVTPNGVDLELYNTVSRDHARVDLNICNDAFILIFIGRLVPIKGLEFLVKAISKAKNDIHQIKLLLVGYGSEKENLENITRKLNIEDNVAFLGPIENIKIPLYLSASDIFILPSLSEGLPLVILEAMAAGLPIIATKITGMSEIIKEGENGYLVEPANPDDLAERIIYLYKNKEVRKTISRNNKLKSEQFGWEKIVKKLENTYKMILNG